MKFGRKVKAENLKAKFDIHKKLVKGQGYRGQTTVKKWQILGCNQDISWSYQPISIKFGKKVKTETIKAKFDMQENLLKVKATGVK